MKQGFYEYIESIIVELAEESPDLASDESVSEMKASTPESKYSHLDSLQDAGVVKVCKCKQCSARKKRLSPNSKRILNKQINTHRRRNKPEIKNFRLS